MKYYQLSIEDVPLSEFLFREAGESKTNLRFRKLYLDLVCTRCRKLDEIAALRRGIDLDVSFKFARDIMMSSDDQVIVSARFRDMVQSVAPDEIEFYEIPSNCALSVAIPKILISPAEKDDAFNITGKCGLCGRYTEATWGAGIPKIPADCNIVAYRLETHVGMLARWEVNERVAHVLKHSRPKLKGLILRAR